MPPATARCSAAQRVDSLALMRIPPVTPPPSAISEISRPVRPRTLFLMAANSQPPVRRVRTFRLRTAPSSRGPSGSRCGSRNGRESRSEQGRRKDKRAASHWQEPPTPLERFHPDRKQKPLWHFCVVAFSDGKPDSTFPENALAPERSTSLLHP